MRAHLNQTHFVWFQSEEITGFGFRFEFQWGSKTSTLFRRNSFIGRLAPMKSLGLRYSAIPEAILDAGWPKGQLADDAWILIDGESPKAIRWVLALSLVLVGFAGFSLWATTAALRPARSK